LLGLAPAHPESQGLRPLTLAANSGRIIRAKRTQYQINS